MSPRRLPTLDCPSQDSYAADGEDSEPRIKTLALVWCSRESDRIGEILLPPGNEVGFAGHFGRYQKPPPGAWALYRQRPGANLCTGGVDPGWRSISSRQFQLTLSSADSLSIRNLRPTLRLLVNGRPCDGETALEVGDQVELEGKVLFLCLHRKLEMAPWPPDVPRVQFPFGHPDPSGFVGESEIAWGIRQQAAYFGPSNLPVLVSGATGTGKEQLFHALHLYSGRGGQPLRVVNAAKLVDTLAVSQLFGSAPRFLGAQDPGRQGSIQATEGGTLVLDEIAQASHLVHSMLLRLIENNTYLPLGDKVDRPFKGRFIAATNCPATLKFDLASRLRARIELPPLADRRDDIALILQERLRHFVANGLAPSWRMPRPEASIPSFSLSFVSRVLRLPLKDNVRELDRFLIESLRDSTLSHSERPLAPGAELSRLSSTLSPLSTPLGSDVAGRATPTLFEPETLRRLKIQRRLAYADSAIAGEGSYGFNRRTVWKDRWLAFAEALAAHNFVVPKALASLVQEPDPDHESWRDDPALRALRKKATTWLNNLEAMSTELTGAELKARLGASYDGRWQSVFQVCQALHDQRIARRDWLEEPGALSNSY